MADITERYDEEAEREAIIANYNAQGYWMLHDDYDPDWKRGDELHGTLTFTNTVIPPTEEQLKEMLADQRMAKLRDLLKQGAEVVITLPPNGKQKITNIFINPASEEIEHNEVV